MVYQINQVCTKIPKDKVYLAYSAGTDSVAALSFLLSGKNNVELIHYNHGTKQSDSYQELALESAKYLNLKIHVSKNNESIPKGFSKEEFWRKKRYQFFEEFNDAPIITAHHLNDQIETYLFNCFHGKINLIKPEIGNFIRPFLFFEKEKFFEFAKKNKLGIRWSYDPTNEDVSYCRNRIRKNILPEVQKINPGINKTIIKLLNQNV